MMWHAPSTQRAAARDGSWFSIATYRLSTPPPDANLSPNNEVHELIEYVHRDRVRQYFYDHEDLQKNEYNLAEEKRTSHVRRVNLSANRILMRSRNFVSSHDGRDS